VALLDRHIHVEIDPTSLRSEARARRALRDQIARLERDLVAAATSVYPRLPLPQVPGRAGPRLLGLGELEAVRDDLADRLSDLRGERAALADRQAAKRVLIEKMLLEPDRYRWVRVTNEEIGEPGCKNWHVRPRLGLIGMLAGWWHVKISSGCPLAWGPWLQPRPRSTEVGKRSRKRADGPVRAPVAPAAPRPSAPRPARKPGQSRIDRFIEQGDARPKPPWHPVPLIELSVLAGIVLIVIGFINYENSQGRLAIIFGVALASLAGLDTALRDHLSGFRSHSALLGTIPAVVAAFLCALFGASPAVTLVAGLLAFAAGFYAFRAQFKRRTGVGFRV
jgi:hypothetical protein